MIVEDITSNMQDYLKAILIIEDENKITRAKDIALKLDVKSSSVNSAVKYLASKELITYEKYGYIQLTKKGREVANTIKAKNDAIYEFLTEILFIEPNIAEDESCNIEHNISNETFKRLTEFCNFIKSDDLKSGITKAFKRYLETGEKVNCFCGEK